MEFFFNQRSFRERTRERKEVRTWNCRSENTRSWVSFCSSTCKKQQQLTITQQNRAGKGGKEEKPTVSLSWIALTLILVSGCFSVSLKEKTSSTLMSFPLGDLLRIRTLPQASDCNVRFNSSSSMYTSKQASKQGEEVMVEDWCGESYWIFVLKKKAKPMFVWSLISR